MLVEYVVGDLEVLTVDQAILLIPKLAGCEPHGDLMVRYARANLCRLGVAALKRLAEATCGQESRDAILAMVQQLF